MHSLTNEETVTVTPDVTLSKRLAVRTVGTIGDSVEIVRIVRVPDDDTQGSDHSVPEKWVDQACHFLESQWPRQLNGEDHISSYREKIIQDSLTASDGPYTLPCSYLLIKDGSICAGHGRLTECFENAGGRAAAITFVVIDSIIRGRRLGTSLMQLLEEEAKRLGYHYMYLWTTTAIPFYEKLGYQECQRVSLKRDCLRALDGLQVEGLEALLHRKSRQNHQGESSLPTKSKMTETIMLAPHISNTDDANPSKDIWMRKRLVEQVQSQSITTSDRLQELKEFWAKVQNQEASTTQQHLLHWKYFLHPIPWQAQIGPSCGLAALRMVREYYFSRRDMSEQDDDSTHPLPSLLEEAQTRGYTTDGELFDAHHLLRLAIDVCGLDCEMMSIQTLLPSMVWNELRRGGVWILPYDNNQRTRSPGYFQGMNAHYGIIVGLSVGVVCEYKTDRAGTEDESPTIEFLQLDDKQEDEVGSFLDQAPTESIMMLLQHGLSPRLSIARFKDFLDSNLQLLNVDSSKFGAKNLDLKDRIVLCRGATIKEFL